LALCSGVANAQAWPNKPVKLVVPFPAGGTTDVVARMLAQRLQDAWGQAVVVENKTGAGGNIGANDVAKSRNDGYTLLLASGSILTVNPHIYAKMPFDATKDLVPITSVASGPMVIVVSPQTPAANIKEFIALAKSKPGALNFGSAGIGSQVHMAGENFLFSAGIEINHVPYKGESPALSDVAGGSIDMLPGNLAAMLPFIKSGKVKALGVTSAERSPAASDIPTISESGLPGFVNLGWFGLLAPAGTSKEILDRIHADTVKFLGSDEARQRLLVLGMVPVGNTPAQFADSIKREHDTWANVVKQRKIQSQ
jgi:tripartite-type tricarboxylate transporter receptor subunit TctC